MTAAVLAGVLSGLAYAGDTHSTGQHDHMMGKPAAMTAEPSTDGIVRAIDRDAGTITVEHGPIQRLGMVAMTMPYHVKDRAMLTAVKPGDKVKMSVEKLDEAYTITILQRVQ
jgi:Cu/Ag efflux protein CusF